MRATVPTGPAPHADTIAPTLELTGRERVTITDYKTSDVRDPVKARQRARESLQLQIYAMAYEARGRPPAGRRPAPLPRYGRHGPGRGGSEAARQRARAKIAAAAAGIRARDFTPRPGPNDVRLLPFPAICPSSVAP